MDLGVIGIILSIVFGITAVISIVLNIRLAKRKKPVWTYLTRHIIGRGAEAPPELKLTFGAREVTDVYKTVIVFFNRGNDVIEHADVVESVTINFGKAEILRQPTVKANKPAIGFSAKQLVKHGDSAVEFGFQWLGHNDGAVVEVLHTHSDAITCSGEIKNVRIVQLKEFVASRPANLYGNLALVFGMLALVVWMGWYIVSPAIETSVADPVSLGVILAFFVFLVSFLILSIWRSFRYKIFPSWSRIGL